jgi:DNA ligase-1
MRDEKKLKNCFLSRTFAYLVIRMQPTLLNDYQGQPVSGWLMSEKLDGWRVMWDGAEFVTREGNILAAPAWFKAGMPTMILDGELFAGRGNFNAIQTLMAAGWHGLTFQAFDAPSSAPFRARYKLLCSLAIPAHVGIVKQIRCADTRHLIDHADAIVSAGGEGAVVRNPRAPYISGRTTDLLRWVPQPPRLNRVKRAA